MLIKKKKKKKKINDTYGHHTGDTLLQLVSSCLKENIREYDYIFRLGGDEFVLFLPELNEKQAYHLAERIRANTLKLDLDQNHNNLSISCSIGISEFKKKDENIEAMVRRADEALYEVKNSGKNSVKVKIND